MKKLVFLFVSLCLGGLLFAKPTALAKDFIKPEFQEFLKSSETREKKNYEVTHVYRVASLEEAASFLEYKMSEIEPVIVYFNDEVVDTPELYIYVVEYDKWMSAGEEWQRHRIIYIYKKHGLKTTIYY